jgi:hypothetical protein
LTASSGSLLVQIVDPDIIDEKLVGQPDLLDVASPVTDLIAQLDDIPVAFLLVSIKHWLGERNLAK